MGFDLGNAITAGVASVGQAAATGITSVGGAVATAVTSGGGEAVAAATSIEASLTSAAVGLASAAVEEVADVVAGYALAKFESFCWDLFNKWLDLGIKIAFFAVLYVVVSALGCVILVIMTCCCICCSIARCHRNKMHRHSREVIPVMVDEQGLEITDYDEKIKRFGNDIHPKGIGHLHGLLPKWKELWNPIWHSWSHQFRVVLPEMLRFWPFNRWSKKDPDASRNESSSRRWWAVWAGKQPSSSGQKADEKAGKV